MWEEILKAIPIYFSCMFKFILGPLGGFAAGLSLITTIITTVAGMMTVVISLTYFGNWLREKVIYRLIKKPKRFSPRSKRFVVIWKKYGLPGVALLTPLILTPIGGTLLAVSAGGAREKIVFYMLISAIVWAVVFSVAIYFFGQQVLPDFVKP